MAEGNKELCEATKLQPEKAEYEIGYCGSGQEAFYYVTELPYNVILLNRMLSQVDGPNVLNGLRRMGVATPVIITTALDGINDRIGGLDAGADDHLVRLYALGKLPTRTRTVTRRPGKLEPTRTKAYSNISLDPGKRELTGPSGTVRLSKRESALMEYLVRNARWILTRGIILPYMWGSDSEVKEGDPDNYVYFLRRRLESVNGAV